MPRNNRKKIILVGDDSTGKTTALRSLLAQIRPRIDDPQNHLGVQNAAGASDTNVTAKKDTPKENGKSKKREPSTDSSDSSDDDEANEKLREEINSKFTLASITVDSVNHDLEIWDSQSENDFKGSRKHIYYRAYAVVLFFALDSKKSLENVSTRWKNELKHVKKRAPIILVGNKSDLRSITMEEAKEVATKFGAKSYFECSAKTSEGIKAIFDEATKPPEKKKCIIS